MPDQRPLKILLISMHYAPEPCDTRTSTLARDLAAYGHQTTVLTSFPNYPFGKVYDGWKQRPFRRRVEHGVELIRVPMFPDHSKSVKRRAISYLSFLTSAVAIGGWLFRRPDLIWIHHPPLTTGIAGAILAKIRRVPYVYEVHDVWPDTLVSTGMVREGRIVRAIRKVCNWLHAHAAAVIVTSGGMKRRLAEQGTDPNKVHVIPQWADENIYQPVAPDPAFAKANGLDRKFNVLFAGNIGAAQGLDTVLDAAALLKANSDIGFSFVGAGLELDRLQQRAIAEGLGNVQFLGQRPAQEMPQFFANSQGLLVHLRDEHLFSEMIPSKIQVYMACGCAILCGVAGDAATLVRGTGAGIAFPPENAQAMAEAVQQMASMSESDRLSMGRQSLNGYRTEFARGTTLPMYEVLFRDVVAKQLGLTSTIRLAGTAQESSEFRRTS